LGIDPGRISKWRQHQNGRVAAAEKPSLSTEQIEIRRLQKELKEAQLERDIQEPSYYYWLKHPVGCRILKQEALLVDIHRIYDDSAKSVDPIRAWSEVHGSARITSDLRELGIRASRPRVARRTQMQALSQVHEKS
jgi:hypothetical protein